MRVEESEVFERVENSSIKLGISAFAWTSRFEKSHVSLLGSVRNRGIQGFEIPMFEPDLLPLDDIKAASEANGVECTVCALLPSSCNPISPSQSVRRDAVTHLQTCVESTAKMGATLLGGPLFAPIGYLPAHRRTADEWKWAVATFRALRDVLDANNVELSIEPVNRSETFFLRTAAEAKTLCEEIGNPRIGVTMDTFHANIEELNIPNAILSLGSHLKHVHASENDRGPLGRGHVPFWEIIASLRQINYRGYLMIEGFGYDPEETDAPGKLWAATDVTPETLLNESASYLKPLLRAVAD